MRTIVIVLLISLVFSTCTKDDNTSPSEPIANGKVDLDCPAVGQRSLYEHSFSICSGEATTFALTGDTLILQIIGSKDNLFLKESYTEGSISYGELEDVTYPITDRAEYLLLPERDDSRLFFFYANDTLWKAPIFNIELEHSGCSIMTLDGEPFQGNDIGYLANYDIGTSQKSDITTVSCEPFFTLDAFLLYNSHNLEASHVADYGGIIPQVNAWSRIE